MIIPSEATASLGQTKLTGITAKSNAGQKSHGEAGLGAPDHAPLKRPRGTLPSWSKARPRVQGAWTCPFCSSARKPVLSSCMAKCTGPLGQALHRKPQPQPGPLAAPLQPLSCLSKLCGPPAQHPEGARGWGLPASSPPPLLLRTGSLSTSFPLRPTQGSICCLKQTAKQPTGESSFKIKFILAGSLILSSCPFWY